MVCLWIRCKDREQTDRSVCAASAPIQRCSSHSRHRSHGGRVQCSGWVLQFKEQQIAGWNRLLSQGTFWWCGFFTILLIMVMLLKGQFTQKKSSFTHLNFVTNPYDLFSFCKIQKECYFFHTMKAFRTVKFQKGQKYIDAISVIGQCYTFLYRITQYWINIY